MSMRATRKPNCLHLLFWTPSPFSPGIRLVNVCGRGHQAGPCLTTSTNYNNVYAHRSTRTTLQTNNVATSWTPAGRLGHLRETFFFIIFEDNIEGSVLWQGFHPAGRQRQRGDLCYGTIFYPRLAGYIMRRVICFLEHAHHDRDLRGSNGGVSSSSGVSTRVFMVYTPRPNSSNNIWAQPRYNCIFNN